MRRADGAVVGLVGIAAAVLFAATTASFSFPGESARLVALVRGLDVASGAPYPLTRFLARLLGGGNALAPVCGAVSTALVCALAMSVARRFVAGGAARLAGLAAAALFAFSPTVRGAATHLEPRLFGLTLVLSATALFGLARGVSRCAYACLASLVGGVMLGAGAADQPLVWWLAPLLPLAFALLPRPAGGVRRAAALGALFLAGAVLAFVAVLATAGVPFAAALAERVRQVLAVFNLPNWALVFAVAPLPFVLALVFGRRIRGGEDATRGMILLHLGVSFLLVLALVSPVSPSALMVPYGLPPVASSALSALTAAGLFAFWRRVAARRRVFGACALAALALAAVAAVAKGVVAYDRRAGAFADSAAEVVLDELGERTWLVTDGFLDGNLRLAAAARGRELTLVSLDRRGDEAYRRRLADRVRESNLGGARNCTFQAALSLGVLPFAWEFFGASGGTVPETARQRLAALVPGGNRHFALSELAGYFGLAADVPVRRASEDSARRTARAEACRQHVDRATALLGKGGENVRAARDAFFVAAQICPEAVVLWDRVIGLDMALGDEVAAEAHARAALGLDRTLASANYVLGSLALERGDLAVAEGFLRRAAEGDKPMAAAANDLAEVLLRTGRNEEAVRFARQAMALAPTLAVACETAAEAILASGGDRDEAARLRARARELAAGAERDADVRKASGSGD